MEDFRKVMERVKKRCGDPYQAGDIIRFETALHVFDRHSRHFSPEEREIVRKVLAQNYRIVSLSALESEDFEKYSAFRNRNVVKEAIDADWELREYVRSRFPGQEIPLSRLPGDAEKRYEDEFIRNNHKSLEGFYLYLETLAGKAGRRDLSGLSSVAEDEFGFDTALMGLEFRSTAARKVALGEKDGPFMRDMEAMHDFASREYVDFLKKWVAKKSSMPF
jgi:hypothetical protein